eukprot:1187050-Prorocentrum_minimum.AAC.5
MFILLPPPRLSASRLTPTDLLLTLSGPSPDPLPTPYRPPTDFEFSYLRLDGAHLVLQHGGHEAHVPRLLHPLPRGRRQGGAHHCLRARAMQLDVALQQRAARTPQQPRHLLVGVTFALY